MTAQTAQSSFTNLPAITTSGFKAFSIGAKSLRNRLKRQFVAQQSSVATPRVTVQAGWLYESVASAHLASTGVHPVVQIIWDKARALSISPEQLKSYLQQQFGVSASKSLNDVQIALLAETFEQIETRQEFELLLCEDVLLN